MSSYKDAMQQTKARAEELFLDYCSTPVTMTTLARVSGLALITVHKKVKRLVDEGRLQILPPDLDAPRHRGPAPVRFLRIADPT